MKTSKDFLRNARIDLNSAMCDYIKATYPETISDGRRKRKNIQSFVKLLEEMEDLLND